MSKWLNNSVWPINRTTLGQRVLESKGNARVPHIPQIPRTSPSDAVYFYLYSLSLVWLGFMAYQQLLVI